MNLNEFMLLIQRIENSTTAITVGTVIIRNVQIDVIMQFYYYYSNLFFIN